MPAGYPIVLDVVLRPILIVGGGAVASRKAAGVLAAGATAVRAVSPVFAKDFPAGVERIIAEYSSTHLEGIGLVFAATDSAIVNATIVSDARQRGIWVQRADGDDDEPGDFTTPAILRRGAITVAVSAGSPALAAVLRDRLTDAVGDEWVHLAEALARFRPRIKSIGLPIQRRREIFRALASAQAADVLAQQGAQGLWDWARRQFADLPEIDWKKTRQ